MKEVKIEAGKRYLVEVPFGIDKRKIVRLTIKEITKMCYLIEEDGMVEWWEYKKDHGQINSDAKYKFIECLDNDQVKIKKRNS